MNDKAIPDQNPDIAAMGYEQARDELAQIVTTLENGRAPLEESMRLWERGEALAKHCQDWLDGAQRRIDTAMAQRAAHDETKPGQTTRDETKGE